LKPARFPVSPWPHDVVMISGLERHVRQRVRVAMGQLRFIKPLLPTAVDEPPDGPDWFHEVKYDGYRTQVILEGGTARAFTRQGYDWSERYAHILAAMERLPCGAAIIDGEVIVQDARGVPDFQALVRALKRAPKRLVYIAFDLLHLDGEDLRGRPLEERRAMLKNLLPQEPGRIGFSDHLEGEGPAFFRAAAETGLEGIVSKRRSSRYRSGRSRAWLKTKALVESRLVVIGSRMGRDKRPLLLLAREGVDGLAYAGTAVVTLTREDRERLYRRLDRLARNAPAVSGLSRHNDAQWVEPRVRVAVRGLAGGALRHATVRSLLEEDDSAS
jgi:bifunctional non-homologous end joining protein LigD